MGINLHRIANTIIRDVHPNEQISLYQSKGQKNEKGKITPVYSAPVEMAAQVQTESDESLRHINNVNESDIIRRFYMSTESLDRRPSGLIRTFARTGDLIYRHGEASWWLVTAIVDDFSSVGWVCVRATQQIKAADFKPEVAP